MQALPSACCPGRAQEATKAESKGKTVTRQSIVGINSVTRPGQVTPCLREAPRQKALRKIFMREALGFFEHGTRRMETAENRDSSEPQSETFIGAITGSNVKGSALCISSTG